MKDSIICVVCDEEAEYEDVYLGFTNLQIKKEIAKTTGFIYDEEEDVFFCCADCEECYHRDTCEDCRYLIEDEDGFTCIEGGEVK